MFTACNLTGGADRLNCPIDSCDACRIPTPARAAGHRVEPPAGQPPDPLGDIYVPKDLLIRAPSRAATLLPEVREIIRQVDPEQPVSDVRLLREVVSQSKRPTGAPSSGYWVHWQ